MYNVLNDKVRNITSHSNFWDFILHQFPYIKLLSSLSPPASPSRSTNRSSMKVVALVSGGKDSCYSILKCHAHGHEVVALAHVTPPSGTGEADSFMYQSVASSVVPLIAEALQLPLFTVQTGAKAIATGLSYTPTPDDEVEDLVRLLRNVKDSFPDLGGVCAGALWSDYQRLRVESAVSRLGMLSIAYLWRRDQKDLLDEMVNAGVHAVLVKVAGVGLNQAHLGQGLAQMRPLLLKLEETYGSHVCGEGGEFETLVLWMPLFHKRIVLDETETVLHSDDAVAPVAYLNVLRCHLEDISDDERQVNAVPATPPVPQALMPLEDGYDVFPLEMGVEALDGSPTSSLSEEDVKQSLVETSVGSTGNYVHVAVRHRSTGADGVVGAAKALRQALTEAESSLGDIIYVWLYLETVKGSAYSDANRAYTSLFGIDECTPPPSRACVAAFPSGYPVIMEAFARRRRRSLPDGESSHTLHVQSLSEWAPPCIGPYAQVVEDAGISHICGVLPLHAPSASIPIGLGARAQVRACSHNMTRTLEATRTTMDSLALFVAYVTSADIVEAVEEEMKASFSTKSSIFAIVPVCGLPKAVLVEVRALGAVAGNDVALVSEFVEPTPSAPVDVEVVRAGNLVLCSIRFPQSSDKVSLAAALLSVIEQVERICTASALSLQMYCSARYASQVQSELASKVSSASALVMESPWIPRNDRAVALLTLIAR